MIVSLAMQSLGVGIGVRERAEPRQILDQRGPEFGLEDGDRGFGARDAVFEVGVHRRRAAHFVSAS